MRFYLLFLLFLSVSSLASEDIPKIVQQAEESVWAISNNRTRATGFFISKKHFATSLHFIFNYLENNNYSFQNLRLSQKGIFSDIKFKRVRNLSFGHDLAILEIDQEVSDYLTLPSKTPKLTDSIFAIGYPKGLFQIAKNINPNFLINEHKIDSYFNLSNLKGISGAPVLNEKGELIGLSQSGARNELSAIRSNHLKNLMESSKDKNISIESLIKKKILEPNDVITRYTMGMIFDYNKNLSKKYMQNSFQLIKKSAEEGFASAQNELGRMYYKGEGVGQDYEKAFYWYKLAAKQGDASAQYNLGTMFYDGKEVNQNYKEAFYWTKQAAKQGYSSAQYNLGVMFYDGKGVDQNYKEAFYWFEQAAKKGFILAQNTLGMMYYKGEGVDKDLKESFYWYKLAAKQGDAQSQFQLGTMMFYYNGLGAKKNIKKALQWIEKAAEQGHVEAQEKLKTIQSSDKCQITF